MALPADTALGPVTLTVADLGATTDFYAGPIGLAAVERDGQQALLGAEPGQPVLRLLSRPGAPERPRRSTGLFHLALLVGGRAELASALARVGSAGHRFTGASDHLVSEALYLDDPEGNGIEIYRDRPRAEWSRNGDELAMATLPLDLDAILAELPPGGGDAPMAAGTAIGHVHLNVADLAAAEEFYAGVLGFDVTSRSYPGALFVSAGGYHHHLGLNTWNGPGAPAPPAGSRGLERFEIVLPSRADVDEASARLERAGVPGALAEDGALEVLDPSRNRLSLRAA